MIDPISQILMQFFLIVASFFIGGWLQTRKVLKMVRKSALYQITDYYGVTEQYERDAMTIVNQRKIWPGGRMGHGTHEK